MSSKQTRGERPKKRTVPKRGVPTYIQTHMGIERFDK